MTYISHLNQFLAISYKDERLSSTHISMYLALFYIWNTVRFQQNFFINRDTVMALSHIGSKNTYLRMLEDLQAFGYIRHEKPTGKYGRSRISIRRFSDKPDDPQLALFDNNGTELPGNTTIDNTSKAVQNSAAPHTNAETQLRAILIRQNANMVHSTSPNRYASQPNTEPPAVPQSAHIIDIDTIEGNKRVIDKAPTRHYPLKKNEVSNTKTDGAGGQKNRYAVCKPVDNNGSQVAATNNHSSQSPACPNCVHETQTEGITTQPKQPRPQPWSQPQQPVVPAYSDVKQFFIREMGVNASAYSLKVFGRNSSGISTEQTVKEALKFFSHYSAIGWMLGGINPIVNWKAAARKWLLNCWQHIPPTASKKDPSIAPANYHVVDNNSKDYNTAL